MRRIYTHKSLIALAAVSALAFGCDDEAPTDDNPVMDMATGGTGGTPAPDMMATGGTGGTPVPDMAMPEPDMMGAGGMGAGGMGAGGMGAGGMGAGGMGAGGMGAGGMGPVPMGDVFSGRITALAIAADTNGCRDLNGDGMPNNSLSGTAALANGPLDDSLIDGTLNLLPTSIGLAAPGMNGMFTLALFDSDAEGDDYRAKATSINADGTPAVAFSGAEALNGAFSAGPGDFPVTIAGADVVVSNASISGDLTIDGSGLSIANGIITGIIPADVLVAALPPEFAGLIGLVATPDIDISGDGIPDAYSTCLTFTSTATTLLGYPVE